MNELVIHPVRATIARSDDNNLVMNIPHSIRVENLVRDSGELSPENLADLMWIVLRPVIVGYYS